VRRASDEERAELEALIARCGIGDRRAFSSLYDRTAPKLFGIALRVLNDRTAAEEVLQEAYVKIWAAADRFAPGGASPMTWLITITRNAAIDRLRRAGGVPTQPMGERAMEVPTEEPGPEARAVAASEWARLDACLAELPDDRAAAVRGAYLDGDSYAILAERHGVPLNTMRTWLRRALITLRECLSR
jgi:RNA polymerase sigma-70 factor (ECF subfamily)